MSLLAGTLVMGMWARWSRPAAPESFPAAAAAADTGGSGTSTSIGTRDSSGTSDSSGTGTTRAGGISGIDRTMAATAAAALGQTPTAASRGWQPTDRSSRAGAMEDGLMAPGPATVDMAGEISPAAPPPPPPKIRDYSVQPGDTASGIASRFGLKTETVLWANGLTETSLLSLGAQLRIPARDGIVHKIAEGDTLWDLAVLHQVDLDAIILANPDVEPGALQLGQPLLIPGARPTPPARAAAVAGPAPAASPGSVTRFGRWPLQGPITSEYGWRIHPVYGTRAFHEGLDVGAPAGSPITAVAAGTVTLAEWYGGWGLTVKVDHGGGLVSRYSHASVLLVKPGETVVAGQAVARVGSTGISTGPHLDFGVYVNSRSQNPVEWLP